MTTVPTEAERLHEAGRKKILRTCLIWGGPLLAILVIAGLQYAGEIHLEEHFAAPPNNVEERVIWLILAAGASFQFLCVAIGVLQGWGGIRRAKQLRQQSAPGEAR